MAEPLVSRGVNVELSAERFLRVGVLGPLIDQASMGAVEGPPFGVFFHEVLLNLGTEHLTDPSEPAEQRIVAPHRVPYLEEVDDTDHDHDADDGGQPTEISVDPDRKNQGDDKRNDDDTDSGELGTSHDAPT